MEKSSKTPLIASLVALLVIGGGVLFFMTNKDEEKTETTSTQQTTNTSTPAPEVKKTTIVDAAAANPNFATLVTAVKAADLVSVLSDTSKKYTVFAPTNDAFAKLPAGTVDTLLKPENKATLSDILTYHVVAGEVYAKDLSNDQKVTTVNGAELTVEIMDGKVMLVDAKGGKSNITQTDLKTDNGVIHVIDTVVMPN
jgi:uncharacterized surface protein with fasciclin (FAS1) repeats